MANIGDFSKESLLNQAQNVWSMLDEMAESSPEKYKEFIDKQMKEAKEYMKPPEPNMCVQSSLQAPKQWKLYINFCSWQRVPEPKTTDDPIPVIGTDLQKEKDSSGTVIITSVAFNPKIIEECGKQNTTERDLLIKLAIKYVENQHDVQVSSNYQILGGNVVFKGNMEKFVQAFNKKTEKSDKEFDENMSELQKNFAPLPSDAKDTILNKFANIAVSEDTGKCDPVTTSQNSFDFKMPSSDSGKKKKGLIEEISTSTVKTACPKYTLECVKGNNNIEEIKVRVTLDGVSSVKECCLDISKDDMKLEVDDRYSLHINFPHHVLDDEASAKFSKKTSVLTITVPTVK
ncbi:PIH1 domain-containing protein 2-like [Mytilus trossulus]|uniref:PIH1 domain-containing protein 2-like n=1 Tax=Mytilus trossulus TaxID=6551 RepID=UPI003004E690